MRTLQHRRVAIYGDRPNQCANHIDAIDGDRPAFESCQQQKSLRKEALRTT
ncbi:hypothetical protein SAMN06273570_0921 [Candidatus Pantoea floridensis]|uniref:Uncharacterized protein n=1 Tax=Candidatus Pantoea floridensis TaxID=1938870 RepID=A0A286BR49_9GAMM|nr:hypothetical protein SAMN06273570_0921 [Pantoea floridensis]